MFVFFGFGFRFIWQNLKQILSLHTVVVLRYFNFDIYFVCMSVRVFPVQLLSFILTSQLSICGRWNEQEEKEKRKRRRGKEEGRKTKGRWNVDERKMKGRWKEERKRTGEKKERRRMSRSMIQNLKTSREPSANPVLLYWFAWFRCELAAETSLKKQHPNKFTCHEDNNS